MIESPGFLFTVLAFLLVIGPLIFVHELGHYFVGRWFGVKAETFSIGFSREMFGWTDRRGTRWKVAWLPLGGYVRFKGDMNPASTPSPEWLAMPADERAQTFQAKPVWQRFLIVLAGPATNFLLAILIYVGLFASFGHPQTAPVVGVLESGSVAETAGIRLGDRIVRIDGQEIRRFEDISAYVALRPAQQMRFELLRDGAPLMLAATPRPLVQTDEFGNRARIGRLGIGPAGQVEFEELPAHRVVGAAVVHTGNMVDMMVTAVGQIVSGDRSVKEMGGPLKIAQYSGQRATLGWLDFVQFVALISINLGFINLLPIPLLDGGHLLFYAVEGVRRKPIGPQAQEWAFRTGLAVLLALMVFVTLNDLASFGLFPSLAG